VYDGGRRKMEVNGEQIGPLKKIALDIEAGTGPDRMDLTQGPAPFEFIFGLGRQGLTPFEMELVDKKVGEDVVFFLKEQDVPAFFQHLSQLPPGFRGEGDAMYLKVTIKRVVRPEPREVIGALAEVAKCGDHCCG